MAEDILGGVPSNNQNKNNQGDFTPYPPNRINIRTMESDIEEFKKGGGQVDFSGYPASGGAAPLAGQMASGPEAAKEPAVSQPFSQPTPKPTQPVAGAVPLPPREESVFTPESGVPMKDIFDVSETIPLQEGGTFMPAAQPPVLPAAGSKKLLKILGSVAGIIVLLAAGFAAYWFLIRKPEAPPVIVSPTPTPVETPTPTPEITPSPTPEIQPYISLFTKPADKIVEKVLTDKTEDVLSDVILKEAQVVETENLFKEIVLREKDEATLVKFKDFLDLMIPQAGLAATSLGTGLDQLFENNFSLFLFYDPKAVQMGYVAKIKPNKYLGAANLFLAVEKEKDILLSIKKHFLIDVGEKIGDFRSGRIGQIETRYLPFQNGGLAFDYGFWKEKDLFIVANSKEALNKIMLHVGETPASPSPTPI